MNSVLYLIDIFNVPSSTRLMKLTNRVRQYPKVTPDLKIKISNEYAGRLFYLETLI